MTRKNRSPEENARRAKIRELLLSSNISSMDDIQDLFNTTLNLKTFDYPLTTSNAFDHICRQQTYGFA